MSARTLRKSLARTGWDEIRTRSLQEISKRLDVFRAALRIPFVPQQLRSFTGEAARFFFLPEDIPPILAALQKQMPEQAEKILARAERIYAHRFDLLGYDGLDYGKEIDWHLDVVNGKRAPRKPWYEIRFLDFAEVGDAKVIWELNRHQHWVTLAKAFRLSGETRFAEEIFRQWDHWHCENVYPIGINWASSLEVAFRSMSWLWVWHLLAGTPAIPGAFASQLARALALNGRHIERYLSTYFSPNTHLLGETVGLFFIGTLCPAIPSAKRWRELGWRSVLEESRKQVQDDGMHFEQSAYYHVYALDLFLHSRQLAAVNGIGIPQEIDRTLEKMCEALCAMGQAGPPTRFGDDDGGRVFDAQRNRAEHLLDPLSTAAVLFGRPDFKASARQLREETLWLLGPTAVDQFDQIPPAAPVCHTAKFAQSGIYVLAGDGPQPYRLTMFSGAMGAHTAGHSHAAALGVTLAVNGQELLVDPGTYVYVAAGAQRNEFRGTAAHNTLQVDGADQVDPGGPFSWKARPEARVHRWVVGETFELLVAGHDGYERAPYEASHCRTLFQVKSLFTLVVDQVDGHGAHQLDLHWHFAPAANLDESLGAGTTLVRFGAQTLGMVTVEGQGWSRGVIPGWYSPAYGNRVPAPILRFRAHRELPTEFATLLRHGHGEVPSLGKLERLLGSSKDDRAVCYRYSTPEGQHRILFGHTGGRWTLEGITSDAEVVYCFVTPDGLPRHLIFCSGSFLDIDGQRLLATTGPVERCEWTEAGTASSASCSSPGEVTVHPRALETQPADAAGARQPAPEQGVH